MATSGRWGMTRWGGAVWGPTRSVIDTILQRVHEAVQVNASIRIAGIDLQQVTWFKVTTGHGRIGLAEIQIPGVLGFTPTILDQVEISFRFRSIAGEEFARKVFSGTIKTIDGRDSETVITAEDGFGLLARTPTPKYHGPGEMTSQDYWLLPSPYSYRGSSYELPGSRYVIDSYAKAVDHLKYIAWKFGWGLDLADSVEYTVNVHGARFDTFWEYLQSVADEYKDGWYRSNIPRSTHYFTLLPEGILRLRNKESALDPVWTMDRACITSMDKVDSVTGRINRMKYWAAVTATVDPATKAQPNTVLRTYDDTADQAIYGILDGGTLETRPEIVYNPRPRSEYAIVDGYWIAYYKNLGTKTMVERIIAASKKHALSWETSVNPFLFAGDIVRVNVHGTMRDVILTEVEHSFGWPTGAWSKWKGIIRE